MPSSPPDPGFPADGPDWAVEALGARYGWAPLGPDTRPDTRPDTGPDTDARTPVPPQDAVVHQEPRRWSGRRTAAVGALVLALTTAGGVAAAAMTPGGIQGPGSQDRSGPGGFQGPGGFPGQRGFQHRGVGQNGVGQNGVGPRGSFGPGGVGQQPGAQGTAPGSTH